MRLQPKKQQTNSANSRFPFLSHTAIIPPSLNPMSLVQAAERPRCGPRRGSGNPQPTFYPKTHKGAMRQRARKQGERKSFYRPKKHTHHARSRTSRPFRSNLRLLQHMGASIQAGFLEMHGG